MPGLGGRAAGGVGADLLYHPQQLVVRVADRDDERDRRQPRGCFPRLPEATVQAAVEVDHTGNEALVALPPQPSEIIGSSGSSPSRTSLTPPTWG